jgi:hypothetical protein
MDVKIALSWKQRLAEEFNKPYFLQLTEFVKNEYLSSTVYPPGKEIFNAFDRCEFDQVKVVIIGQDPYHGTRAGQRTLFFSQRRCTDAAFTVEYFQRNKAISENPFRLQGILTDGPTREFCCSMLPLLCGPARRVHTRTKGGNLY